MSVEKATIPDRSPLRGNPVRAVPDARAEFRWATALLAGFWTVASLLFFAGWPGTALVPVGLGGLGAGERLWRVASTGRDGSARRLAVLFLVVVIGVTLTGLWILNPAMRMPTRVAVVPAR